MVDRLVGMSFALLAATVAMVVAVHLVESVAATLLVIAAAVGGLVMTGFVVRLLWRRDRINRW